MKAALVDVACKFVKPKERHSNATSWTANCNDRNVLLGAMLIVILIALGACAQKSNGQGYAEAIVNRPLPVTDAERARECELLGIEIARQRAIAKEGMDAELLPDAMESIQSAARNNVAALESRASSVQCPLMLIGIVSPAPMSGQAFRH